MKKDITTATLTKTQAMTLCEEIRSGITGLSERVVRLHKGQGWTALGYLTWKECIEKEFRHTAWWGNQQLKIAGVRKIFPPTPPSDKMLSGGGVDGNRNVPFPPEDGHVVDTVFADAPEPEEEEPAPEPIAEIMAAATSGKIKATDKQLEALAGFEEETQEAMLESFLAGRQTVANAIDSGCAADPTMEEEIKKQASEIECACRAILKFANEQIEKLTDPWMDDLNRRAGAIQKIKDCCETLRSCKCVAVCPKCEGEGCPKCHKTGRITKYMQQQLT